MGNFHLDVVSNKKISFGCSVKELLSNELRYRHEIVYLNFGTNHPPNVYTCIITYCVCIVVEVEKITVAFR